MTHPTACAPVFDLWVPRVATTTIAPRSAIVSSRDQSGEHRLVYLEGNLYGAENLSRYAERVRSAAGRAFYRYPTIAKARLPTADLLLVGTYDARSRRVTQISDAAALAAYLDVEDLPIVLTAEEARRRIERALGAYGMPEQQPSGRAWDRLHAWTGNVRPGQGGLELECVMADETDVEWLAGIRLPAANLAYGLRHVLDDESPAWS
jgi:hypothetical protein